MVVLLEVIQLLLIRPKTVRPASQIISFTVNKRIRHFVLIFIFTFSSSYSFIIITIVTMEGRFYVVTGAASGIGQAVTIRLAELGAAGIAISDVNVAGLEGTKEKCTNHILCFILTPDRILGVAEPALTLYE
jgi:hypothetical protein